MLGDTPYDIQAARKLGIGTIGLRCGGWDDEGLKGAVAVYDDPAGLLAHLEDSPLTRS
jgi:phosphoglycolate phosphatase-like HAD superfamily hydrolase